MINIVFAQIAIPIQSSPSRACEVGKIWRMLIRKNINRVAIYKISYLRVGKLVVPGIFNLYLIKASTKPDPGYHMGK